MMPVNGMFRILSSIWYILMSLVFIWLAVTFYVSEKVNAYERRLDRQKSQLRS
jgi:hypothetical protein